jgi:hypothetical protein
MSSKIDSILNLPLKSSDISINISKVGAAGLAGKNLELGAVERRHKTVEMLQHVIEKAAALLVAALELLFLASTF